MDTDASGQVMADGIRINYNFIRPYMGLEGQTPAQVAGLDLGLQGIGWKELIRKAVIGRCSSLISAYSQFLIRFW